MVLQIAEAPTTQTCCHHWMIQTSDGPVSLGVCKHCFENREFKNSIEDWSFDQLPGERKTPAAAVNDY